MTLVSISDYLMMILLTLYHKHKVDDNIMFMLYQQ